MFEAGIRRVLQQVHPGMQVSPETVQLVDSILQDQIDRIIDQGAEQYLGPVLYDSFLQDQRRVLQVLKDCL